jgi:hypothetical protein
MGSMKRFMILLAIVFLFLAGCSGRSEQVRNPSSKPRVSASAQSVDIKAIHDRVCPRVVEYVDCTKIAVQVADFGATGWNGYSGPAAGTVQYNTHYPLSAYDWERIVSHEMGGHHDSWAEVSARGTNPWVDYYDLDTHAVEWLAGHGYTFDKTLSKELYSDCAGPVAHGYPGVYMQNRGIPSSICTDSAQVMERALTD